MDFSQTSIVDYTLYLLVLFSILSWIVIIFKTGELLWHRARNHRFIAQYRQQKRLNIEQSSPSQACRIYERGIGILKYLPESSPIRQEQRDIGQDLLERTLQQQLHKEKAELEKGLGWLATFGSISPFVGLFGTVWGIKHALQDISQKGSASLEVVAGPIGEALIATALGIAVAIPAVIGYNFFLRQNRSLVNQLEFFANDFLHSAMQRILLQQPGINHGHTDTK